MSRRVLNSSRGALKHISSAGWIIAIACGCGPTAPSSVTEAPSLPKAQERFSSSVDEWSVSNTFDQVKTGELVLTSNRLGVRISPIKDQGGISYSSGEFEPEGEEKIIFRTADFGGLEFLQTQKIGDVKLDFKSGLLTATGSSSSQTLATYQSKVQMFIEPDSTNLVMEYSTNAQGIPLSVPVWGKVVLQTPHLIKVQTSAGLNQFESDSNLVVIPRKEPGMLSIGIERGFNGPRSLSQIMALGPSPVSHYKSSLARVNASQAQLWKSDIEIDGPKEDQQAIRSVLYRLRTAFRGAKGDVMAPFGLTNSLYFGHKFWDMDMWIGPSLALIDPEVAGAAAAYRFDHLEGARQNWVKWGQAGFSSNPRLKGINPQAISAIRAKFPWESSVSGRETVPGESQNEDHISMSILWGAKTASALGAFSQLDPLKGAISMFVRDRSVKTDRGLEILHTVSPDESFTGNNDLYTNLLAQWTLNDLSWKSDAERMYLPRDSKTFFTYDGDRLKGYKQAAAILSIFPLQFPQAEKESAQMMERFAGKATLNGPAMTDSVESTIWSRMGEKDKGYEAWKRSWEPFAKDPLMLFSEKRKSVRTYFYTGAAGALSAVIYGFIGCNIDDKPLPDAAWKIPLKERMWLSIKPNMPIGWNALTFRGMKVLGKRYTVKIKREKDGTEKVSVTPEK